MKTTLKLVVTFFAGLAGLGLVILPASAMPMNARIAGDTGSFGESGEVSPVRWVCPPYSECFWVPGRRHARRHYDHHRHWHHYGHHRPRHDHYGWREPYRHHYW